MRAANDSEQVRENYEKTALAVFEKICPQPALVKCFDTMEVRLGQADYLHKHPSLATTIATRRCCVHAEVGLGEHH